MSVAVRIRELTVRRGGQPVVDRVSCDIPRGQVIGLLGPSGSGKTTLLRAIVGAQRHVRGTIRVFGKPAGSPALRRRIGYMTQELAVYPDLTIRENLRYFASIVGAPRAEVDEVLDVLELTEYAGQVIANLSGGQQARVSLGVALLGRPKLLILDEPTVGLDPVLRRKLWNQFARLARGGTTLIVSSHVMDEAAHCDRLLLLRDGRLLAHDTPARIKRQTKTQTIEDAFLKLVREGA